MLVVTGGRPVKVGTKLWVQVIHFINIFTGVQGKMEVRV